MAKKLALAILLGWMLPSGLLASGETKVNAIYKILLQVEWEKFQGSGNFSGSALDVTDGFIHCSYAPQLEGVRERFFKGKGPLVVLEVDATKLGKSTVKVEANKSGGALYPHIYGSIPLAAVTLTTL